MPCGVGGGTHRSWPAGRGGRPRALIPGEGVREGLPLPAKPPLPLESRPLVYPPVHQASSGGYPPPPHRAAFKKTPFFFFLCALETHKQQQQYDARCEFAPSLGPVPLPPTPPEPKPLHPPTSPCPASLTPRPPSQLRGWVLGDGARAPGGVQGLRFRGGFEGCPVGWGGGVPTGAGLVDGGVDPVHQGPAPVGTPPTPQGILQKKPFFFFLYALETTKIRHTLRNLLRPWDRSPCTPPPPLPRLPEPPANPSLTPFPGLKSLVYPPVHQASSGGYPPHPFKFFLCALRCEICSVPGARAPTTYPPRNRSPCTPPRSPCPASLTPCLPSRLRGWVFSLLPAKPTLP